MDLKALGFDITDGVNDPYLPGDCGIFVTRVDKGSVADGRLRYELLRRHPAVFASLTDASLNRVVVRPRRFTE